MTVQEILQLGGYSNTPEGIAAFYKQYPTEESFMQDEKMQMRMGGKMPCMSCGGSKYSSGGILDTRDFRNAAFNHIANQTPVMVRAYQNGGSSQDEQVIQIIQAYAELVGETKEDKIAKAEEIIKQLQQMQPEKQQEALKQMVAALQQAEGSMSASAKEQMEEQAAMRRGGNMPMYQFGKAKTPFEKYVKQYPTAAADTNLVMDPRFNKQGIIDLRSNDKPEMWENLGDDQFDKYIQQQILQEAWNKTYGQPNTPMVNLSNMPDSVRYQYRDPRYKKQGGIHLDPAKRGTFKAQASRMHMSMSAAADKILNAPQGQYSPVMRRKANFYKNFAKAYGGSMYQEGGASQEQLMQAVQQLASMFKMNPQELAADLQAFSEMNNMPIDQLIMEIAQMEPQQQQQVMQQIMATLQQGEQSPQEEQAEGQMSNPQEEQLEEEDAPMNEQEMEHMKYGGIPERYRKMGFNRIGVKRQSTRPGKKWMVLAKKGDQYKIVHGGYKGMQDFKQHHSEQRRDNFWNRMGGKDSAKAHDPFSPLYWHKRFGTWAQGGMIPKYQFAGQNMNSSFYDFSELSDDTNPSYTGIPTTAAQNNNQFYNPNMIVPQFQQQPQIGNTQIPFAPATPQSSPVGLGQQKTSGLNMNSIPTPKIGSNISSIQSPFTQMNPGASIMTSDPNRYSQNVNTVGLDKPKETTPFGMDRIKTPDFSSDAMRQMKSTQKTLAVTNPDLAIKTTDPNRYSNTTFKNEYNKTTETSTDTNDENNKQAENLRKASLFGRGLITAAANFSEPIGKYISNQQEMIAQRRGLQNYGRSESRYSDSYNPDSRGFHTSNVGSGAHLMPNSLGAGYLNWGKYGGQYQEGGTYYLTDEEIQHILANGGQIEYI